MNSILSVATIPNQSRPGSNDKGEYPAVTIALALLVPHYQIV